MKKRLLLIVSLCAGLIASAMADSHVAIYYPGQAQPVMVNNASRLQQLVSNPVLAGHTWWPGTVIAERLATEVQLQKQRDVLAKLSAWGSDLRSDNNDELANSVEQLRRQIAGIKVTGRQFVSLDPDVINLDHDANRLLRGEYQVYTLARPTSVQIFGVLTPTGPQPFVAGRDVSDYLVTHQRLSGAERSYAWAILPDGHYQIFPVAYWNRRHNEVAPGSTIFVGFSSWSLPHAYQGLNEQIVSLLTHRIPD